jgi:hypothetical protein
MSKTAQTRLERVTEAAAEVSRIIEGERARIDPGVREQPFISPLLELIAGQLVAAGRCLQDHLSGRKVTERQLEWSIKATSAIKEMVIDLVNRLPKPHQSQRTIPPTVRAWLDKEYGPLVACAKYAGTIETASVQDATAQGLPQHRPGTQGPDAQ